MFCETNNNNIKIKKVKNFNICYKQFILLIKYLNNNFYSNRQVFDFDVYI